MTEMTPAVMTRHLRAYVKAIHEAVAAQEPTVFPVYAGAFGSLLISLCDTALTYPQNEEFKDLVSAVRNRALAILELMGLDVDNIMALIRPSETDADADNEG